MIVRSTLFSNPGGDTTQVLMTAKYLRKLDVDIDIKLTSDFIDFKKYHLFHFFNIIRPDDILPFIKKLEQPYCVSTIFVDYSEFEKKKRSGIVGFCFNYLSFGQIEYVKALGRNILNGQKIRSWSYILKGHKSSIKYIAAKASLILPNSHNEAKRFFEYSGMKIDYRKIVNAIESSIFNSKVIENKSFKNHILCVARIEGLKNQYNLIQAIKNTSLQLTIIGKPSLNHIDYYKKCRNLAKDSKNIQFLNYVDHEKLVGIYKAAKVHVLPSWFETTGLSSLEAGAMGCNVVITEKGDAKEYFEDLAYYCDPDSVASIRDAVFRAFNDPVNDKLKDKIWKNYNWNKTAEQTLDAYKKIIA